MKNVLIFGGSKGLGHACAIEFINSKKYNIVVFSRSIPQGSNDTNFIHIETDFSSKESITDSLKKISHISIDVLINNSGGPKSKPFLSVETKELLEGLQSHLLAAHQVTKAVVPKMIENKFGRIINIVSVTANNPLPNMIVSNTIRGAMINWAKTLSKELAASGITVNNLLPGYTETERLHEVVASAAEQKNVEAKEVYSGLLNQIPANRFGKPNELASLALHLASEKSAYINGQSIAVDGGWTPCI